MNTNKTVFIVRGRTSDAAIYKYADSLATNGYHVNLLLWDREGKGEKQPVENKSYTRYEFHLKSPIDKKGAVLFYPLWWLYIIWFLLPKRYDYIHSCDFDTAIPCFILKCVRRKPFIYSIFDFYANNIIVTNSFLKYIQIVILNMERLIIKRADLVTIVDESRIEEIGGSNLKKIVCIYNSPPDLFFGDECFKKPIEKTKLKIFYAGPILKFRGIQYMIEAVKTLDNVNLTLGGSLVDKDVLNNSTSKNINFIGWIPKYDDVLCYSQKSDVLFRFSDPAHPKTKFESPNKLFEAMMLGKPIIVNAKSRMADIVAEENCGLIVPYGDVQAIRKSLQILKEDPAKYQMLSKNGRNAYLHKYSLGNYGKTVDWCL